MKLVAALFRALMGLFVDDGSLAIAILAVVGLAAAVALLMPGTSLVAGAAMVVGCPSALLINVIASARR